MKNLDLDNSVYSVYTQLKKFIIIQDAVLLGNGILVRWIRNKFSPAYYETQISRLGIISSSIEKTNNDLNNFIFEGKELQLRTVFNQYCKELLTAIMFLEMHCNKLNQWDSSKAGAISNSISQRIFITQCHVYMKRGVELNNIVKSNRFS